jgi:hypothetical protein
VLVIPVGSVTAQTELTYEYGVRRKGRRQPGKEKEKGGQGSSGASGGGEEGSKVAPLLVDGKPHLPFQLQIEYTAQDGSRCMRVITQAKPITTDRDLAEKDIDMSVVGTHVARTTASLAVEGEYSQARLSALSNQRLLQRTSHVSPHNRFVYNNLMEDLIPLENRLRNHQQTEEARFGRQYSDEEGEEEVAGVQRSELMATRLARPRATQSDPVVNMAHPVKKRKAISRRKEAADDLAAYCYQMKSSKSSEYSQVHDDSSDEDGEV